MASSRGISLLYSKKAGYRRISPAVKIPIIFRIFQMQAEIPAPLPLPFIDEEECLDPPYPMAIPFFPEVTAHGHRHNLSLEERALLGVIYAGFRPRKNTSEHLALKSLLPLALNVEKQARNTEPSDPSFTRLSPYQAYHKKLKYHLSILRGPRCFLEIPSWISSFCQTIGIPEDRYLSLLDRLAVTGAITRHIRGRFPIARLRPTHFNWEFEVNSLIYTAFLDVEDFNTTLTFLDRCYLAIHYRHMIADPYLCASPFNREYRTFSLPDETWCRLLTCSKQTLRDLRSKWRFMFRFKKQWQEPTLHYFIFDKNSFKRYVDRNYFKGFFEALAVPPDKYIEDIEGHLCKLGPLFPSLNDCFEAKNLFFNKKKF